MTSLGELRVASMPYLLLMTGDRGASSSLMQEIAQGLVAIIQSYCVGSLFLLL